SDQNQLKILAQQMIEHLETLSGVSELSESTETLDQEAVIHIDVEKAKNLGLTPQAIARQISFTIRGISNLPSINLQGKEIKMVAQLRKEDREGLETLRTMTFFSEKKEAIKLFNFARISFRNAQGEVTRRNGKSSITVTGKFTTDNIKEIEEKIKIKVRNFPLPVGYSIGTGETFEKVRSDQKSSLIAFVLSIVLIYLIMGVLFESFILPFSILISIPLAFIGTIWLLFLTETSIGTMAFIGMIVLTGVVVNNAIVLVDAINLYRKQGMEMVPAILLASKNRLRPILMTSMTTIFGLVPMALGTANIAGVPYAPLGRTVAGGLASSMLLTLFIVPLFYILFENLGDTLKRLFSRN
ncbi:MAG: HAE1 family hydrophobic/amphiphilic exporter-1, partial [bacterium]